MNKNKKIILGVLGLALAVVVLALLYINLRPQPKDAGGDKTITVTVVYEDKSSNDFTIKTNEDYLSGALLQEKLIEGSQSEWGLYVTTVNGVTADDSKHQYWALYIGDEYASTGVDSTPVNDGDSFRLVLETY
ncbi:MAG: DUF4430 domain-containing protein [Lachnospiraceae bacterium]